MRILSIPACQHARDTFRSATTAGAACCVRPATQLPTYTSGALALCPPSYQVLGRKVFSRVVATKDSKEESWMEVCGDRGM